MAFSHTESISGTEHMKNSEPKSCDPYVDSLIRNADAKEARAFLKILKPLPFLIVIIAVFFFWVSFSGTVAKLAMRQPFVLFKGLTFQKLCLPGAFRPGDHHNKMLRPGLCVVHASPQYL